MTFFTLLVLFRLFQLLPCATTTLRLTCYACWHLLCIGVILIAGSLLLLFQIEPRFEMVMYRFLMAMLWVNIMTLHIMVNTLVSGTL